MYRKILAAAGCVVTPPSARRPRQPRDAMTRTFRRLAILGLLFAAPPAFAHAALERASPAAGAELHAPPPAVRITFTEGVEPHFSTIVVLDAANKPVTTGPVHADGPIETLAVDLPKLPPGRYTVVWHATSVDTHKSEGRFTFTVLP
jgi:copper resistance protein C